MSRFVANLYLYKDGVNHPEDDRLYIGQLNYSSQETIRATFSVSTVLTADKVEEYDSNINSEAFLAFVQGVAKNARGCGTIQACRLFVKPFVSNLKFEVTIDEV